MRPQFTPVRAVARALFFLLAVQRFPIQTLKATESSFCCFRLCCFQEIDAINL